VALTRRKNPLTTPTLWRARLALALVLSAGLASVAAAQAPVTSADIQRLQDNVDAASQDVAALRSRDAALAGDLQTQLDDARDETIYLKVKLRKREPIVRSEYAELRDRIEAIRTRARSGAAPGSTSTPQPAPVPAPAPAEPVGHASSVPSSTSADEVPAGTQFDVRLQDPLSSATSVVEDRFEVTTLVDLRQGDRSIVPAGSIMRGIVSSVKKAGRIDRTGSLTVAFDQMTITGRTYPIRATVTQALESGGIRGEAARIGIGAGVGAVIGAILGGPNGALAGILIGGGGTIAATPGTDVDLKPGTTLRVRLDAGLNLR
jgi:hypothetical protein